MVQGLKLASESYEWGLDLAHVHIHPTPTPSKGGGEASVKRKKAWKATSLLHWSGMHNNGRFPFIRNQSAPAAGAELSEGEPSIVWALSTKTFHLSLSLIRGLVLKRNERHG